MKEEKKVGKKEIRKSGEREKGSKRKVDNKRE
jgi:hypothetical protein